MKYLVIEDDAAIRDAVATALSADGSIVESEADGDAGMLRAAEILDRLNMKQQKY